MSILVDYDGSSDGRQDNTARLQSLLSRLENAGGGTVRFLLADLAYLFCSRVHVPSNIALVGFGSASRLRMSAQSTEPLFDLGSSRNITIEALNLQGNAQEQKSTNTGSCAVVASPGCCGIRIINNMIENWGRHGLQFDGVRDLEIKGNRILFARFGAGILLSKGSRSHSILISENKIFDTQFANIHAWGEVSNIIVCNNHCVKTGGRGGHWDTANIADNITIYSAEDGTHKIIAGNICMDSRESGIHASGSGVSISNNVISNPQLYGILVSSLPHANPITCNNVIVIGNSITFSGVVNEFHRGIGIRNSNDYVISSNIIRRPFRGIELFGVNRNNVSLSSGIISANILSNCCESIIYFRGSVVDSTVTGNRGDTIGKAILRRDISRADEPVLLGNNFFEAKTAPAQPEIQTTPIATPKVDEARMNDTCSTQ